MALPNVDPSLPSNIAPLFSDSDAARGDHMRANNAAIWGNLEYLLDGPVNGISASATAEANKLLALDANAKLPASITGDAASCSGNAATATRLNLQQLNAALPFYTVTTIGGVFEISSIVQNMPRDNEYWTLILTGSTAAGTSGALQYTAISSSNPGEIWTQMLVNGVFAGWKKITNTDGRSPNSDTVDGIHASATAEANKLLALDANAKLPASITGSSLRLENLAIISNQGILDYAWANGAGLRFIINNSNLDVTQLPTAMSGVAQYLECETSGYTSSELRVTIYSYYSLEKWSIVLNPSGNNGWVQLSNTVGYAGRAYSVTGDDYLHGTYTLGQIATAIISKYGNAAFSVRVSGSFYDTSSRVSVCRVAWVSSNALVFSGMDEGGNVEVAYNFNTGTSTSCRTSVCF